jgi:hypoxanthine phosphoribosyltransferase
MSREESTVLFGQREIEARVAELAERISRDYAPLGEVFLVGVLKGAFIFLADLARRLRVPHRIDFVALGSYGDAGSARGAIRLIMDLRASVQGRHVLVVDDIVDTGSTLRFLKDVLAAREPASIRTCVLTRKPRTKNSQVEVDYVGFEIPDVWVVGYGLDYADRYRTLPHIAALSVPEGRGS